MSKESPIEYLKGFLKGMFRFNAINLNLGRYRIYNLKRKGIESCLVDEDGYKVVMKIPEKHSRVTQIEVSYDFNILATLKDPLLHVGKRVLGLNVIQTDVFNQ